MNAHSPAKRSLRRFFRNRRAVVAAAVLLALGLSTLLVPWISPHDYREQLGDLSGAPTGRYWMGTDSQGRDLLTRLFLGGRISFAVGLMATTVSLAIGVAYGAVSAFIGGRRSGA